MAWSIWDTPLQLKRNNQPTGNKRRRGYRSKMRRFPGIYQNISRCQPHWDEDEKIAFAEQVCRQT